MTNHTKPNERTAGKGAVARSSVIQHLSRALPECGRSVKERAHV